MSERLKAGETQAGYGGSLRCLSQSSTIERETTFHTKGLRQDHDLRTLKIIGLFVISPLLAILVWSTFHFLQHFLARVF